MPVYNTSNTLDNSMYLKTKLPVNKVSDNYYIENLQYKRNQDWNSRFNIVNIEEELQKQSDYTLQNPTYTPIDVAIRKVKNEYGKDLGTDWSDIAFRDLKHYNDVGSRYRFSTEFPDMSIMSEEDKHYNTSIWICVNKNPVSAGNNCIIRRCNSTIGLVGSPNLSYDNINEIHYEPIILENDLKYISFYYNMTLVVPQAEWYATAQLNYFSNSIKLNDRVIFGGIDMIDDQNNAVYKVKAIVKASAKNTFSKDGSSEIDNIPLCVIAFDKDLVDNDGDNFYNRIAEQAPIYLSKNDFVPYEYYIGIKDLDGNIYQNEDIIKTILLTEKVEYKCVLMRNGDEEKNLSIINNLTYTITSQLLQQTEIETQDITDIVIQENIVDNNNYYVFSSDEYGFSVQNTKPFNMGVLRITCSCINPDTQEEIVDNFDFILGGFY